MKTLIDMTPARREKLASNLRMQTGCEVEVISSPTQVKYLVSGDDKNAFYMDTVKKINTFCKRYGLTYVIYSSREGKIDLTIL